MGRPRESAHIRIWRGKHYLVYTDFTGDKPKEVRKSCAALKVFDADGRAELVKRYMLQEKMDTVEVARRGGRLAYDYGLIASLDEFLADTKERADVRAENPDARNGISAKTAELLENAVIMFKDWLTAKGWADLRTGQLDGNMLAKFFDHVATAKTRLGYKTVRRRASTVNQYRRNIRTALRWINRARPPRFPDFESFAHAFKMTRSDAEPPRVFTPKQLKEFFKLALQREDPERKVVVVRFKPRGEKERFEQPATAYAATPVSRLFLMLALTGARVGEILALKWDDVDLERGRLTIRAQKTGKTRILPLMGAPEGDVSPGLVALLRRWRLEAGAREYVLPHDELPRPVFPKSGWQMTAKLVKGPRIGPQALRQNFTSYAASIGIPAAVAAMWQGHAADVAEKHYRAQVLDRNPGKSIEEAMGLEADKISNVSSTGERRNQANL
jgi:integrase